MASPAIRAENLGREFGSIAALDGLDFDLEGPGIVGVAGPNGAGKTTLMHVLLGLLEPTDGAATVDGVDPMAFAPADRRGIGYMPQHEALYRELSVEENVAFFADLYGVADRPAAVDRTLGFVELTDRADARIGELSGGMRRRTSLACALVHEPDLMLLDEPTVGLDPALRARMWRGFREHRESGTLILVSTHYLGEARHCDRVMFLRDGRLLALDTPGSFLERTATDDLEDAFLALLERDGIEGVPP